MNHAHLSNDPFSPENQPMVAARMIARARERAKKVGRKCTITPKDILPLPAHCPIFKDLELTYMTTIGNRNNAASLDRIDSTLGYAPGNVRIVSFRANTLKSNATGDEIQALFADMLAREIPY